MTEPQTYRSRRTIEAMQISDQSPDDNRLSIASISGWMMGHGFTEFRVMPADGDGLFGLELLNYNPPRRALAGDHVTYERRGFMDLWNRESHVNMVNEWEGQS
jgi:hypothetical protein